MAKRLVVFFDGTWNSSDSGRAETNVARLARAVHGSLGQDGVQQVSLYLRGVGSTGVAVQRLVGGAFGEGVGENIRAAYMFLSRNYVPGDEIFLFGFSRGAYSARSLSGMIGACGLLKRQEIDKVTAAWTYYRNAKPRSPADFCARYRGDCHLDVRIAFLGVWDTVGALGIPQTLAGRMLAGTFQFHDTAPSRIVLRGRHALAIDEHRGAFLPTLWTGTAPPGSDIVQMWFAGAHSDVGGGYGERGLADIPLLWMAEEARKAGLQLDPRVLPSAGGLDPCASQHDSRGGLWLRDRLAPTIRPVMGPVMGRAAETVINPQIHPSVRQRFGQPIWCLRDSFIGAESLRPYRPKNLRALLG